VNTLGQGGITHSCYPSQVSMEYIIIVLILWILQGHSPWCLTSCWCILWHRSTLHFLMDMISMITWIHRVLFHGHGLAFPFGSINYFVGIHALFLFQAWVFLPRGWSIYVDLIYGCMYSVVPWSLSSFLMPLVTMNFRNVFWSLVPLMNSYIREHMLYLYLPP